VRRREHVGGAGDVVGVVEDGNVVREPLGGVRGQMVDNVRGETGEYVVELIGDRRLNEGGSRGNVLAKPSGEVVQYEDRVTRAQQTLGDVRADESRAPGDDRFHVRNVVMTIRRFDSIFRGL
jgi:hypothetical protein